MLYRLLLPVHVTIAIYSKEIFTLVAKWIGKFPGALEQPPSEHTARGCPAVASIVGGGSQRMSDSSQL